MKKIISIVAAMGIVCALTACSRGGETESTSSEPAVGDFNFIQQATVISSSSSGMQVSVSGGDGEVSGGFIIDTDSSSTVEEVSKPAVETGYKDLSTNSSLQLGANVYVSIPTAQINSRITLTEFVQASKEAYSLLPENQRNSLSVRKDIYKNGSCVHSESNKMFISGIGFVYLMSNKESTLSNAKTPSIKDFNLSNMSEGKTMLSVGYAALGDLIFSDEQDDYYTAVYEVNDKKLEDTTVARAALIFDKATSTLVTCLITTDTTYAEYWETEFSADIAIDSFRYTTVAPDNLARIF